MRIPKTFLLLLGLLILVRMLQLLTGVETFFFFEELYRGVMGSELLKNPQVDLASYRPDVYSGGFVIVAYLASLFFLVLGTSLFSLKLVALTFQVLMLAVLYGFLKRHVSERAGFWVGLLFIFSPPGLTKLLWLVMGFHSEAILFALLQLFFLYSWLASDPPKPRWICAWAFCGGLGFWFTGSSILVLLAGCLLVLVFYRDRCRPLAILLFSLFLILGLLPWVFSRSFGPSIDFYSTSFDPINLGYLLALPLKMLKLLFVSVPLTMGFNSIGPIPGWGISISFWIFLIMIKMLGLVDRSKPIAFLFRFVLAYEIAFVLVYSLSAYQPPVGRAMDFVHYRYFSTLVFLYLITVGVILSQRHQPILLVLFLIYGVLGQSQLMFQGRAYAAIDYRPTSKTMLGHVMAEFVHPFPNGYADFQAAIQDREEGDKRLLNIGYFIGVEEMLEEVPWQAWNTAMKNLPKEYRPWAYEVWGNLIARIPKVKKSDLQRILEQIEASDQTYVLRGFLRQHEAGLGPWEGVRKNLFDFVRYRVQFETQPANLWQWRGYGASLYRVNMNSLQLKEVWQSARANTPQSLHRELAWGLGWATRQFLLEDEKRNADLLAVLGSDFEEFALEGQKAHDAYYRLAAA